MNRIVYSYQEFTELLEWKKFSSIFIITDTNCKRHCLPVLLSQFRWLKKASIISVSAGEQFKNIVTVQKVWHQLVKQGASRQTIILNLGGGVVTDMGGFVASTFFRGIPFINISTTIMGMADASIGGKNGINLSNFKNQVGTFNLPLATCIFPVFLNTLPQIHVKNGLAEMIKHSILDSKSHFEYMNQLSTLAPEKIFELVPLSIEFKQKIVEQDYKEHGMRKILNFGHTLGHAIESSHLKNKKQMLHGYAISYGMWLETMLSMAYVGLETTDANKIFALLEKHYGLLKVDSTQKKKWIEIAIHDKKNNGAGINFALIEKIGKPIIDVRLTKQQIFDVIRHY